MISVVVPVYNNASTLRELYDRFRLVLEGLKQDYELIFVDDGSRDASFGVLKSLHEQNPRVKIIQLSTNFGQTYATVAGIETSQADTIITLDADLQYDPGDIPRFLEKMNEGFDVVCGRRKYRRDNLFSRRWPSLLVNIVARIKIKKDIKDIGCSFMAFKKVLMTQLNDFGSKARFFKPSLLRSADKIAFVDVRHYRSKSGSQYSLRKLFRLAWDFLVNFK